MKFFCWYFRDSQNSLGWKRPERSGNSKLPAIGRDTFHWTRLLKSPIQPGGSLYAVCAILMLNSPIFVSSFTFMLSRCTFLLYVTTYQSLQHSWRMNSLSLWKLLPHPGIPLCPGGGSRSSHRAVHAAAVQCLHEHTEFCSQTLLQQRLNHWFMLQTTMQIAGSPTSTKQVSVYQGRAGHTKPNSRRVGSSQLYFAWSLTPKHHPF